MIYGLIAVFACLMMGAGCTTATEGNQSLTKDNVCKITKGLTTRAQVEEMLGPPDQVTLMPDGRRMMNYQGSQIEAGWSGRFIQSALPFLFVVPMSDTTTMRRQTLEITLDRNGIVDDYEFENGGTETVQTASAFGAHSETKSIPADPATQGSSN